MKKYLKNFGTLKTEVLSGLTVALALVPEAVAFAFVAGVHPLVGIHAAIMIGFLAALLGGRPGMISGATGALAVVMVALVADNGVEYLFATVVLMGILQLLAGAFKLGKFIRMVPHPVVLGFVNGLAIVIMLSQINMFKSGGEWLDIKPLSIMIGLALLTAAIIIILPKFTKAIPSSLAAILVAVAITIGFNVETSTVKDFIMSMGGDGLAGSLPMFHLPVVPFTLETLYIIFPYAAILAAIGLIESLMTLTLIDEMTETHGNSNRECLGQGTANIVTGFFSGMGGCAMIGQSMININSGGRHRLSGISAALFLLSFLLFAAPWIEMIPLAALVGLMFVVVIKTFAWGSLRIINKVPKADIFVIILVTTVTVLTDLAIAVISGVLVSTLVFAWKKAHDIYTISEEKKGVKYYKVMGPLFFASTKNFQDLFNPKEDPKKIVVDFKESRVYDHSALEAINTLADRYQRVGKKLTIVHLSTDCRKLLKEAGSLVKADINEDPEYTVAH